jgi:hypothetical protein
MMVPRVPPAVAPTSVLRPDWETLTRLASRWSKPPDLNASPAPSSLCQFCGATDKLKPAWFWSPNQEIVAVILRPKSPNQSYRFWGPNRETRRHQFWGQTWENCPSGFEAKPLINRRPWFWGSPENPRSSSPYARCKPHTTPPNLSIAQPLSTRHVRPSPVLCTRSSTPATILVATRHAAPVTCTPQDKQTWFSNETKNKGKTTKMSWILIQISTSQWLITIKPRNWPLSFSPSLELGARTSLIIYLHP